MVTTSPILYSFVRCPYAIRARFTLAAAGVRYELREVDLKNKPAHLLEISPKGTVPVLLFADGKVLEQSLDIMRWALAQADLANWLPPQKSRELEELIALNDGEFKDALNWYKYPERYPEKSFAASRRECEKFIGKLEGLLEEQMYLLANTLSFADAAIFPFIRQFSKVEEASLSSFPKVQQWLNGIIDSELFQSIMKK